MDFPRRGYITAHELDALGLAPPAERVMKGAVAIPECPQAIPCNPCESGCPFGAIKVGVPITNVPSVDWDKCTGCGFCVHVCPGLAIFIVDGAREVVGLPFEFLPLPQEGEEVLCQDREGKVRCQGQIVKVVNKKNQDHTALVYVKVPTEQLMDVRSIKRKEESK